MSDASSPMPSASPAASNDNVMAAVASIPFIGAVMYFAMPTLSDHAKFYAKQSVGLTIVTVAIWIITFVLNFIPFLGWIISFFVSLLGIAVFILWLVLLINALQGNKFRIPVLSDFVDQMIK